MMKRKGIVSLFVWASIGISLLVALGTWQLFRLSEKKTYLASLDERIAASPISLAEVLAKTESGSDIEFVKVTASGSYFAPQLFKQATLKGGPGFEVLTPFRTEDGITVLVDRGTIPADMRAAALAPSGTVTIQGVVRGHANAQGFFDPENDPLSQTWYWWDVPAMLGTLQIASTDKVAPFVLQQLPEAGAPRYPVSENLSAGIPNNHLQYAFTWFSLAACLAVIAGLLARKNRT